MCCILFVRTQLATVAVKDDRIWKMTHIVFVYLCVFICRFQMINSALKKNNFFNCFFDMIGTLISHNFKYNLCTLYTHLSICPLMNENSIEPVPKLYVNRPTQSLNLKKKIDCKKKEHNQKAILYD